MRKVEKMGYIDDGMTNRTFYDKINEIIDYLEKNWNSTDESLCTLSERIDMLEDECEHEDSDDDDGEDDEGTCTETDPFIAMKGNFSWAFYSLKAFKKVRRQSWTRKSMHIYLKSSSSNIFTLCNGINEMSVGWGPTNEDIFATDWELVEAEKK